MVVSGNDGDVANDEEVQSCFLLSICLTKAAYWERIPHSVPKRGETETAINRWSLYITRWGSLIETKNGVVRYYIYKREEIKKMISDRKPE